MRVIIVGCGRVGSALSERLYKQGHQVTVIDQNPSAFDNLSLDFHGRTIEGDVLARNVLHRAEVEHAHALAAVTRSDSLNALVAHLARAEYKIGRVVARNYDPRQRPLQEAFDIPVVGVAGLGVQRIEEVLSNGPLHTLLLDSGANFAVYRLEVPGIWQGQTLYEMLPEEQIITLSWSRGGQPMPLAINQKMAMGDIIYLSAAPGGIESLRKRLSMAGEGGI